MGFHDFDQRLANEELQKLQDEFEHLRLNDALVAQCFEAARHTCLDPVRLALVEKSKQCARLMALLEIYGGGP